MEESNKPEPIESPADSTKSPSEPTKKPHNKKDHGKRYSFARKLAVKALLNAGMSPTEIEKEEGIDRSTIYNVMKDKKIEVLAQKQVDEIKRSLIGLTYSNAYRAQQFITDEKLTQSSALQLMTVSAIGIEKGRLSEGLSTENVSHRGIIENIESDRQKLIEKLNALGSTE